MNHPPTQHHPPISAKDLANDWMKEPPGSVPPTEATKFPGFLPIIRSKRLRKTTSLRSGSRNGTTQTLCLDLLLCVRRQDMWGPLAQGTGASCVRRQDVWGRPWLSARGPSTHRAPTAASHCPLARPPLHGRHAGRQTGRTPRRGDLETPQHKHQSQAVLLGHADDIQHAHAHETRVTPASIKTPQPGPCVRRACVLLAGTEIRTPKA